MSATEKKKRVFQSDSDVRCRVSDVAKAGRLSLGRDGVQAYPAHLGFSDDPSPSAASLAEMSEPRHFRAGVTRWEPVRMAGSLPDGVVKCLQEKGLGQRKTGAWAC